MSQSVVVSHVGATVHFDLLSRLESGRQWMSVGLSRDLDAAANLHPLMECKTLQVEKEQLLKVHWHGYQTRNPSKVQLHPLHLHCLTLLHSSSGLQRERLEWPLGSDRLHLHPG